MNETSQTIVIVGCGPGSPDYLTSAAREAAQSADVLLGAARLLDLFADSPALKVPLKGDHVAMLDEIARHAQPGRRVAVLVTGDPGCFSLAGSVVRRFGLDACRIIPGISSVQVAFARVGLDWAGALILSAHGRTPPTAPADLAASDRVAILAGTAEALAWSASAASALEATHAAVVCEDLTLPGERIRRLGAREIAACGAPSLAIVLLIRRTLLP